MLEKKASALFGAKAFDEGNGHLEGYASVKNNVDAYGDVIVDGAYVNLETLLKAGWSGMNHDDCVGYVVEAKEDAKGLWVKVAFHSTPVAQECRAIVTERLGAGKDVGMSIMFKTVESAYETRDGEDVRVLKAIEVVEAGFVLLPANPAAQVTQAKSGAGTRLAEQTKSVLDGLADLSTRWQTFKSDRAQGLSEKHLADINEAVGRAGSLVEELKSLLPVADGPPTLDAEAVAAVEARLVATGVL